MNSPVNSLYFNTQLDNMRRVIEGAKDHFRSHLGDIHVDQSKVEQTASLARDKDRLYLEHMSSSLDQFIDPEQIETNFKKPVSVFLEKLAIKASALKNAIDRGLSASKPSA